ncbi:MAG: YebC/PmpR family DNA-binding transcriptional regulator [Pyrinomonadaceae bacterium]|nr:YebC/PmpR family DNA-binding transcriptional regulator [Pyrinomonadaceae bacterium]
MSGHSKWHSIKHKKGAADAKRGKIFTRLARELTVAAREGGGDAAMNARLRKAVSDAKSANMPNDNIDRAIKRGTGEIEGVSFEEIRYEAYGPGGTAILIDTMTDNRNRTVADLRHLLSKNNGNLGESGSVAWMFDRKGYFVVGKDQKSEDELFEVVIEAGAEDLKDDGESFEVYTDPDSFEEVKDAVEESGVAPQVSEISMIPQNYVKLEGNDAQQMMKLYELLDDHDDVQNVYANFDIDESELEA